MKVFDSNSVKATMGTTKVQYDFKSFTGEKPKRKTLEEIELERIEKELKEEAAEAFYQ